jgi:hypothetical protein
MNWLISNSLLRSDKPQLVVHIHSGESSWRHDASPIARFSAIGYDYGFHIADDTVWIWRTPEAEVCHKEPLSRYLWGRKGITDRRCR